MSKTIYLTKENIEQYLEKGVTLIDFWAPWCGPCRMIAPVIEELSLDYDGKANICKVNTDEEIEIGTKYNIRSIPTLLLFKDGELVNTIIGAQSKNTISKIIDKHLN